MTYHHRKTRHRPFKRKACARTTSIARPRAPLAPSRPSAVGGARRGPWWFLLRLRCAPPGWLSPALTAPLLCWPIWSRRHRVGRAHVAGLSLVPSRGFSVLRRLRACGFASLVARCREFERQSPNKRERRRAAPALGSRLPATSRS